MADALAQQAHDDAVAVRLAAPKALAPVAAGVLLVAVGADHGGYFPVAWGWAGVVLAWAAVVALLLGAVALDRVGIAALGTLTAFVAWVALTWAWSDTPGKTLSEAQRDLMYPLVLFLALVLVRRESVTLLLGAVAVALDLLAGYGLLTRLAPARFGDFDPLGLPRLWEPVDYSNALGLLVAMALLLTLGFAVRGRQAVAAAASGALVPLAATLYFTFSHGASLALAAALLALVAVDRSRLHLTVVALAVGPFVLVGVWCAGRYASLTGSPASLAEASRDGRVLALTLLVLAAAAAGARLALVLLGRRWQPDPQLVRGYALLLAGVAATTALAVLVAVGGPVSAVRDGWDQFSAPPLSTPQGEDLRTRYSNLSGNGRVAFWTAAWREFEDSPAAGSGAGSYGAYWLRHRDIDMTVRDAHSLYAETLGETGLVGFGLLAVALLAPFAALRRAREHPLASFAVAAYVAFLVHAGVDWDWEVPVLVFAALLCAAAILVAGRGATLTAPRRVRTAGRAAALAAVAIAGVFALSGLISSSALDAATDAQRKGDLPAAQRQAEKAARWAPWSAEPRKLLSVVRRQRGEAAASIRELRRAAELEPNDADVWAQIANDSPLAGERQRALTAFRRLDPRGDVAVGVPLLP